MGVVNHGPAAVLCAYKWSSVRTILVTAIARNARQRETQGLARTFDRSSSMAAASSVAELFPPAQVVQQATASQSVDVVEAVPVVAAQEPRKYLPARVRNDDDNDVDEPASRRRSHRREVGFRCPYCQTSAAPFTRSKVSTAGWIFFWVLLLFLCLPLCWIGLFLKDEYRVCADCGIKLG